MSPFTSATTIQMFTKQGIGKITSTIYSGSLPLRPQYVIRGIKVATQSGIRGNTELFFLSLDTNHKDTAVDPASKSRIDIKVKIPGSGAPTDQRNHTVDSRSNRFTRNKIIIKVSDNLPYFIFHRVQLWATLFFSFAV